MPLASSSEIEALEEAVERAVQTNDTSALEVVGYGEVSIALKLATDAGDRVCKRLVPFTSRDIATDTARTIERYIEQLSARGINVIETESVIIERAGRYVLYSVQPMLDPSKIGPSFLRGKSVDEAVAHVTRIFELIRASVSPTLAPDGQLSNWAFDDGRLVYLDVGTPFMRDEQGRELFDFGQQTRALPWPIRVVVDRFLIRGILENYHSIRGQALDFLGNLVKEGLPDLILPLVPVANRVFALSPELTEGDVRAHYKSDAQTYELIQAARRADRWMHHHILRRPYPYILPPRIKRFG